MSTAISLLRKHILLSSAISLFFLAVAAFASIDTTKIEDGAGATSSVLVAGEYAVAKVVDGDTFDIEIDGKKERIRVIGVDTPETVDPRKPVQCFGREASARTSVLLLGKIVMLESDQTQGDRDKYGRLLRYVRLADGRDFGLSMLQEGYAHEYTYNIPYERQAEYRSAEQAARTKETGLWGDACAISAVEKPAPIVPQPASCAIKGNISLEGEKIYHTPGCGSYNQTRIHEDGGERWFCSEEEASDAGWRKAVNCL